MGNGRFCRNLVDNAVLGFAERVYGGDRAPDEPAEAADGETDPDEPTEVAESEAAPDEPKEAAEGETATETGFELIDEDFTLTCIAEKHNTEEKRSRIVGFAA